MFAVVRGFMEALRDTGSVEAEEREHVSEPIATIGAEIATALSSLSGCRDLTAPGRLLVEAIARSTARTSSDPRVA